MEYPSWAERRWTIIKAAPDMGLDQEDELLFEVEPGTPISLRIAELGCLHQGTHQGLDWRGVLCSGGGQTVYGTTRLALQRFRITNTSSEGRNVLVCELAQPRTDDQRAGSTGGGVCWTAEDGGRR